MDRGVVKVAGGGFGWNRPGLLNDNNGEEGDDVRMMRVMMMMRMMSEEDDVGIAMEWIGLRRVDKSIDSVY